MQNISGIVGAGELSWEDNWLARNQRGGKLEIKKGEIGIVLDKLIAENKIKLLYEAEGFVYYKLTGQGWKIVKQVSMNASVTVPTNKETRSL